MNVRSIHYRNPHYSCFFRLVDMNWCVQAPCELACLCQTIVHQDNPPPVQHPPQDKIPLGQSPPGQYPPGTIFQRKYPRTARLPASQPASNLPTYQPASLSTCQPASLPTYQHVSLSAYQPSNLATYQFSTLPAYQPASLPTYRPTCLSACQPTSLPACGYGNNMGGQCQNGVQSGQDGSPNK